MQNIQKLVSQYASVAQRHSVSGAKYEHKVSGREYLIFTAGSRQQALSFLRAISVTKRYFYVIVETPEGNYGRDCEIMFNEADGSEVY